MLVTCIRFVLALMLKEFFAQITALSVVGNHELCLLNLKFPDLSEMQIRICKFMLLTILAKATSVYEEATWFFKWDRSRPIWNLFNQIFVFDFHKGHSPTAWADPGFPVGGGDNPLGEDANIWFCQIFWNTAWNWENLGPYGGAFRSTTEQSLFEFVCKYPQTTFITGWYTNWKQRTQFVTPIAYSPYHTLLEKKQRNILVRWLWLLTDSMLSESQIYENLSRCAVVTRKKEYCVKLILYLWPGLKYMRTLLLPKRDNVTVTLLKIQQNVLELIL